MTVWHSFQNDVAGLFFCGCTEKWYFDMSPWKDAIQMGHISCLGVPGSCVEGDELQPAPVGKATDGSRDGYFPKLDSLPKGLIRSYHDNLF